MSATKDYFLFTLSISNNTCPKVSLLDKIGYRLEVEKRMALIYGQFLAMQVQGCVKHILKTKLYFIIIISCVAVENY